ncbi:SDR family NAD(P)-dependent oxidoreductase [Gammaproteobacteria bacterium]|nr:SDR family NAD(P)-dependent oxidoreductase [Gammaproteobacteria bacterium]
MTDKILVTGADGFIGSHLTEMLLSEGYSVRALTQYNSFNNWGWLEDLPANKNLEIVQGDIRDRTQCQFITRDIDTVFHLASLIAIPYSYSAPQSYVDVNVTGTLNICEASMNNKVSKVIHTSTSEVYGTALYVPIDENHPLQPQSPYSASKIAADALAKSFFNSFELPLTIARPFNTYGPRQSARAVIPSIIIQMLAEKKEIELGDISPTRDFNYVEDTCRGLISLAKSESAIGETFNLGSNSEISIERTFYLIKDIIGSDSELKIDPNRIRPKGSEVHRLVCDNSKLIGITDHSINFSFQSGLELTIDWFKEKTNLKKYKSNIYNV